MHDLAVVFAGLTILLIIFAILCIPSIFFFLTLRNTLEAVAPHNRTMSPNKVWLNLIPIFAFFWNFYTVYMIRDSLAAEFQERGVDDPGRGAFTIGIIMCILSACTMLPFLKWPAIIGALIFWILYWVKMVGYRDRLRNPELDYAPGPAGEQPPTA